jgi:uncharacterized protein YggU (UPF0235/DUF167 family)
MTYLTVRVKPGAKTSSVREDHDAFIVCTPARPEAGKANKAMLKLLAEHLKVAPSTLEVVHGSTSRTKVVRKL